MQIEKLTFWNKPGLPLQYFAKLPTNTIQIRPNNFSSVPRIIEIPLKGFILRNKLIQKFSLR
jgi:hypothetical protein